MKKTSILLLACMLAGTGKLSAQSGNPAPNPTMLNVTPPSPNAASLGKFGDVPVGYFTGIPQINVPIYSYKNADNSLSMSISLDYHAGGVKVDEMASNAGIGWSLNAGGAVTRTRRGLADELSTVGFMNSPHVPDEQNGNSYLVSKFMEINGGSWDGQSDVFNFNVGGRSGKFMFGKNGDFLMLSPSKVKVIPELSAPGGAHRHFTKFTLIAEDGTKYVLDAMETTITGNFAYQTYQSAWYVTKIIAPFGSDEIQFEYEDETYGYATGYNQSLTISLDGSLGNTEKPVGVGLSGTQLQGKRLKKITYPDNTQVQFTYDNIARTDVGSYNNIGALYRLKQVTISNGAASRGYNLYHDYSTNRLTLKDVIPFNAQGEDKGYSFQYYNIPLPARLSFSQDHWGFYNSNPYNSMLPQEYKPIYGTLYTQFSGVNRETDVERVKAGSLTRVTYPTGGYTDFEMEAHKVKDTRVTRTAIGAINTQFPKSRSVYCSKTQPGSESFSYTGDVGMVTPVEVQFYTGGNPTSATLTLQLRNASNQVISSQVMAFNDPMSVTHQFNVSGLVAGNYTWNASVSGVDYFEDYVSVSWTEKKLHGDTTYVQIDNPYVGGLRVKSIKNYDGISTEPATGIEYAYLLEDGVTTSGTLGTYPEYTYGVFYDTRKVCGPPLDYGENRYYNSAAMPNVIIRSSSPVQAMAMVNGSPANYTRVEERFINRGKYNGKTVRTFTSYGTNGIPTNENFPYTPPEYSDYSYGQLKTEVVLNANNDTLKKTENDYTITQDNYYETQSRVLNFTSVSLVPVTFRWDDYTCDPIPNNEFTHFSWNNVVGPVYFLPGYFTPSTGRKDLSKTKITEYNGTATLVNEMTYTRDQNFNVVKTTSKNSRNEVVEEVVHYPYKFTGNAIATTMLSTDNNMYAVPIAVEKWKTIEGAKHLIGSVVNQYQQFGTAIRKATIESLENTSPVPEGSVPAIGSALNRAPALIKPKIEFQQYNPKGFIVQQAKVGDLSQSIIWDYNQQYPIAEVMSATADRIAYTSFESAEYGGWALNAGSTLINYSNAKTGARTVSGGVNKTVPAGDYVISFWSIANTWVNGQLVTATPLKIEGEWWYFEIRLNNASSVHVTGDHIDEVRLYPAGAQMKTYTYNPLFGLTSTCDVNSRVSYFEYDGFGRLKNIRDEKKNILKRYDYQFQKNTNQ